jgi:hypothetical protein
MTLSDIATLACQDVGDLGQAAQGVTMLSYVKAQIRRNYESMYNMHPWKEAMMEPAIEQNCPSPLLIPGTSSYWLPNILPLQADKVQWVKGSIDGGLSFPYKLDPRDRGWIEKYSGDAFLTTLIQNVPRYFFLGKPLGFPAFNPGAITITPIGTASGFPLTIEGTDTSGLEQSEMFSMTGTNPITTVKTYAEVHNITKPTGTVPLTIAGTGATVTMQPNDEHLRYTNLVIWPPYTGPFRIRVGAKMKFDPLLSDNSVPRISGLLDALYHVALAAAYSRQKQKDMSNAEFQSANAIAMKAVEEEMSSQAAFQQIVPKVYDDPGQVWNWSD